MLCCIMTLSLRDASTVMHLGQSSVERGAVDDAERTRTMGHVSIPRCKTAPIIVRGNWQISRA